MYIFIQKYKYVYACPYIFSHTTIYSCMYTYTTQFVGYACIRNSYNRIPQPLNSFLKLHNQE